MNIRTSFWYDYCLIMILFLGDVLSLGLVDQPQWWLMRTGYWYFLFDRTTPWYIVFLAGVHLLVITVSRGGLLEYELPLLLIFSLLIIAVRSFIQLSSSLWVLLMLLIVMGQHAAIDGFGTEYTVVAWTIRAIFAIVVGSLICLWLGRKVGRAIA